MDTSRFYNETVLWRSPLIKYSPEGSWDNGKLIGANGKATFSFYGTGILVLGDGTRDDYSLSLDGEDKSDYTPQRYTREDFKNPTIEYDVHCDNGITGQCVYLADFRGLDPNKKHTIEIGATGPDGQVPPKVYQIKVMQDTGILGFDAGLYDYEINRDHGRTFLTFEGDWEDSVEENWPMKISRTPGDSVTFHRNAYSFVLYGSTAQGQPTCDVTLDGETTSITPGGGNNRPMSKNALYMRAGLDQNKNHTFVVTNRGTVPFVFRSVNGVENIQGLSSPGDDTPDEDASEDEKPDVEQPGIEEGKPDESSTIQNTSSISNSPSPGLIAGIVIGAIAMLALLVILGWYLMKRKQQKNKLPLAGNMNERVLHPFIGPSAGSTTSPPATPFHTSYSTSMAPGKHGIVMASTVSPLSQIQHLTPPTTSPPTTKSSSPQTTLMPLNQPTSTATQPISDEEQVDRILEMLANRIGGNPNGDNPPGYQR